MKYKEMRYEDYKINVKLVLSGLWASVMFLYIYGDYFELYVPGKTQGLLNGQNLLNTPYKLLSATIILTLPSLMIFLSLIMKPKWNRILNISIAAFLTLFTLLVGASSLSEWRIFYVMLAFLESILTAIIVWKAWHWPRM
jgi:multisubunit Na+/H+ antiporter MnhF subunit